MQVLLSICLVYAIVVVDGFNANLHRISTRTLKVSSVKMLNSEIKTQDTAQLPLRIAVCGGVDYLYF